MEIIMPIKGYTWNEEYKKKFYSSEKVKAHLEDFIQQAKQPKSETQKIKMSAAKKGLKYSKEHKDNMSETQRFRQALRKEIETKQPDLSKNEVWNLVRQEMEQHD